MITRPQVLALDEPTFGQDRARAAELLDLPAGMPPKLPLAKSAQALLSRTQRVGLSRTDSAGEPLKTLCSSTTAA